MNEGSVHDPDGAVQGSVGMEHVLTGGAQRLQPVEEEDEHAHDGDGGGDARPHGQVERGEQGEDVDLFLGLPQQDAHAVVQVTFAEVHNILALRRDGDGGHREVRSLETKSRKAGVSAPVYELVVRNLCFYLVDQVTDHSVPGAVGKLRPVFTVRHLHESLAWVRAQPPAG